MKIVIAGGNGFLGTVLQTYFQNKGNEVWVLTRKVTKSNDVNWDAKSLGAWTATLEGTDVLINLTGKSVDCRYTESNKKEILRSRIDSTRVLNAAIGHLQEPPKIWLNASSATTYIHATTQLMNEENGIIGDDFSMNICKKWEAVFFEFSHQAVRKVALRTSIVLGNDGGAYPRLKMLTRLFLGGHQGDGSQMMSWIHINDFCKAIQFIIDSETIGGVVNVTAPHPVSNQVFMQALRNKYNRTWGLNQSKLLLEIGASIIHTESELLLKSRNVYPLRLMQSGFQFDYPVITSALSALD